MRAKFWIAATFWLRAPFRARQGLAVPSFLVPDDPDGLMATASRPSSGGQDRNRIG